MSKRKKKSIWSSTFYRVYFALLGLALVGIAAGTLWLRGSLADYESAQPVYVARDVAKLFEDGNYDALYTLDDSAAELSGGDPAFYVQSLRELTAGKRVDWSEAFSSDENLKKYAVTLDGERFATFTLVPSGKTTRRGNRLWTLGGVTTHVALEEPEPEATPEPTQPPEERRQCRITAPKGYAVTVDGEVLTADNSVTGEKNMFEAGFLPEGVPNPVLVEYLCEAGEAPQITAVDENGDPATVLPSPDAAYTWECLMRQDETYRAQYGDAAYALGQQVAKFISRDGGKKSLQRISAKFSPAEEIFDNLSNRYTTPHTAVDFRNPEVSEFYVLSEDCFTCHVAFDYVLTTEAGEMVYPTAYTFCMVKQGDSGRLYNLLIY